MPHNPVKTGCKVQQMYKLPAFENKYHGFSIIKDKEIKVGGKTNVGLVPVLGFLRFALVRDRFFRMARMFKSAPDCFKELCSHCHLKGKTDSTFLYSM